MPDNIIALIFVSFANALPARLHFFLRRAALTALCALALALVLPGPAAAQQTGPGKPENAPESTKESAQADQPATRIEVSEETGIIRFIIEGEERARLDASGFHVREDIEYGGTITDTGIRHYGSTGPAQPTGGEGADGP